MPNGYPKGTIMSCGRCGCRLVVQTQENGPWPMLCLGCRGDTSDSVAVKAARWDALMAVVPLPREEVAT